MKTLGKIYLMICVSVLSLGCERTFEEGDRNTYTVQGTLFEGTSDVPLKNADLHIEAEFSDIPDNSYEIIAEGTSNENGYFSLTYKKIQKADLKTLRLYLGNRMLLIIPNNENLTRDVAEYNHRRIFVEFTSDSAIDTLFTSISFLMDESANISRMEIPGTDEKYNVYQANPKAQHYEVLLKSSWISSNIDNETLFSIAYGQNKSGFQKAMVSAVVDSIPDDFQRVEFVSRGFPYTDTVRVNIQ